MKARKKIDAKFIKARQELIDKGIVKNKTDFAAKIGSYPTVIAQIEKGVKSASISMLIRLATLFREDLDDPVFLSGYDFSQNNILFVSEASAGPSISVELKKGLDRFKLPELEGDELFAFKIKGDSMYPTIEDGDTLVCEHVLNISNLINSQIYVIISSDGINVKRLKIRKEKNKIVGLTLISDNSETNEPFEVDFSLGLHSSPSISFYKPLKRITEKGLK